MPHMCGAMFGQVPGPCQILAELGAVRAEARATAALSHPIILVLHDPGTEGEQLSVVHGLLEGETPPGRLRDLHAIF